MKLTHSHKHCKHSQKEKEGNSYIKAKVQMNMWLVEHMT